MKKLRDRLKILFLGLFIFAGALAIGSTLQIRKSKNALHIGAKNCTEQHLLGEIFAQLVEKKTPIKVVRRFNLEGTPICFNALLSKTIDLYFEYTGTALLGILKEPFPDTLLYPYVKKRFQEKYGLTWLDPLGFSNKYVLITRSEVPIDAISEITLEHRMAFDFEFAARQELDLLKANYAKINWQSKLMDQVLLYFSLSMETVDIISGFSTDARLKKTSLKKLVDDHKCLPSYDIAPLVSPRVLEKFPEILPILKSLKISEEEMIDLNYQVDCLGYSVKHVASNFLLNR